MVFMFHVLVFSLNIYVEGLLNPIPTSESSAMAGFAEIGPPRADGTGVVVVIVENPSPNRKLLKFNSVVEKPSRGLIFTSVKYLTPLLT